MILQMKRFLHVAFVFPFLSPKQQSAIEQVLGIDGDWLRYAPNCWIVYSGHAPMVWVERLQAIRGMEQASFFITEMGTYAGRLDQQVWDWINSYR